MHIQYDDKSNQTDHIEVAVTVKLTKREVSRLLSEYDEMLEAVQLPFSGMNPISRKDLEAHRQVELSHWTDRDSMYTDDDDEFRTLDSMIYDDLRVLKEIVGFKSRAKKKAPRWPWEK